MKDDTTDKSRTLFKTRNRELGNPDVLPSVHDQVAMWDEEIKSKNLLETNQKYKF